MSSPTMTGARRRRRLCLLALVHLLQIHPVSALTQKYCSNQNTGSDYSAVIRQFQTNGLCQTQCQAEYAFAVVQDDHCWCSNFIPPDTVSLNDCGQVCPGYGPENCGDAGKGLFGYVALSRAPSGTAGAASSSPSPTPPSSPTPAVITSSESSTPATPTVESSTSPSTLTTSTSAVAVAPVIRTSTSSTSSSPLPSTWTPTPIVSVITAPGQVKTLTITPTAPPAETALAEKPKKEGFFANSGKVAGTFVVIAVVVLILAGIIIWAVLRRKHKNAPYPGVGTASVGGTPQRRPSRLSQMGLLGSSRRSTNGDKMMGGIQTSGLGTTNSDEKSPSGSAPFDRRYSNPRMVDQRLEPTTIWNPLHDDHGRVSMTSLRDDQDYSRRVLRVANPDMS